MNPIGHARRILLALVASLALVFPMLAVAQVAEAAGPCRVTGYSNHAKLRMAERDWSKAEVKETVRVDCGRGYLQDNGNWIYESSSSFRPTVVLGDQGNVVTVQNPSSGGGGGGGGSHSENDA